MKLLCLFILALIVIVKSNKIDYDAEWDKFKHNYNRTYNSIEEERARKSIFINNYEDEYLNTKNDKNIKKLYKTGINNLADVNLNELNCVPNVKLNFTENTKYKKNLLNKKYDYRYVNLPDNYDWREYQAVSAIKNQKNCGSCWAFAATAVLESMEIIKQQRVMEIDLSEQNLVDCDPISYGCRGGFPHEALNYVLHAKGIDTEDYYPYRAVQDSCQFSYEESIKEENFEVNLINDMSVEDIKTRIVYHGPVIAGIRVNNEFKKYTGGIFNDPYCEGPPNHAVVIVGFGVEDGNDYWIVKNSWDTWWGEDGYIRMSMEGDLCSIKSFITFPDFL